MRFVFFVLFSHLQRMSDPAVAVVAAAYSDPALTPASDRLLDLVEMPLGAMVLLAGLRCRRDGGPLALLVRPLKVASQRYCVSTSNMSSPITHALLCIFVSAASRYSRASNHACSKAASVAV